MEKTDNKEFIKPEEKSESSFKKTLRGSAKWLLVVLGAFVIGVLLIFFTLYNPIRQKLDLANTSLEHANETINTQADQIITLQTENESLQTQLDSTTLHLDVLEALSGLRGASLAVDSDDYAGARLLLIQASEAMDSLSGRLGADQRDVFVAIQQSAAQTLVDVQNNLQSAQPELDQLINNLVQLEDNLFPNP
jgi:chromosome segregation ATPase